jgi:voltage-dependent potassium channel beta subunit
LDAVQYRRLGRSGLRVSALGLGTWLTLGSRLDASAGTALLRKALDEGVNLIDTADVYDRGAAEEALGRLLADVPRKDYVLASKVYFPTGPGPNDRGLSRKHIDETVHTSLRRLRTTYIDLFQCHRYDEHTPVEETVRAFDDLIRQGKLLYWGVSLWSADQIDEAIEIADRLGAHRPVSNQPPYSLMKREVEAAVLPACDRHGLGVLAYSPLAQGVLTGKYLGGSRPADSRAADGDRNTFMSPYMEESRMEQVRRMKTLADAEGITPAQLAIAWILRRPEISSVLVGATKVSQLDENLGALDVALSEEALTALDGIFPA